MDSNILLAQLRSLLERAPNFSNYTPTSREHQVWLAQAYALVSRWNRVEAISVQNCSNFLSNTLLRDANVAQIVGAIHRAIADLEFDLLAETQESFAAGDVYDFFNALHKVIGSAEESLFIIDPYLDQSVFDHYLSSRGVGVGVRLLTSKNAKDLIPSKDKYNTQYDDVLELRKTTAIHDRVIFVDRHVGWLIGQSVKDAAKAKPTYLVQAPPDIVPDKLGNYEAIWESAQVL